MFFKAYFYSPSPPSPTCQVSQRSFGQHSSFWPLLGDHPLLSVYYPDIFLIYHVGPLFSEYIMMSQPESEDQNPTKSIRWHCDCCSWGEKSVSFCLPTSCHIESGCLEHSLEKNSESAAGVLVGRVAKACECNVVTSREGLGLLEWVCMAFRIKGTSGWVSAENDMHLIRFSPKSESPYL